MQKKEPLIPTMLIWVKNPHSQLATGGGDGVEEAEAEAEAKVEEDKVPEEWEKEQPLEEELSHDRPIFFYKLFLSYPV